MRHYTTLHYTTLHSIRSKISCAYSNTSRALILATTVLVFNALWLSAQSTNYYKVRNLDLNHFNLVNVDDGTNDYYAVGSAFDQDSNKVVVYVFRYHSNGTIVWDFAYQLNQIGGRIYGLNACPGDRSTLDPFGVSHRDVVVVGTFVNTTTGYDEIFALEIDGLNGSIKRKREFDFQFNNARFSTADKHAVAQFVTQKSPNGYLIGGYLTSGHAVDFTDDRYGFVMTINQLFQVQKGLLLDSDWAALTWTPPLSGYALPPGGLKDFDMVEHIVEIAPNHYFITGSNNSSYHDNTNMYLGQGVMAIDINGATLWDHGFSGQVPNPSLAIGAQIGMNLEYDPTADKVYLLSSEDFLHGPSITHFNNISTSPVLGSHWDIGFSNTAVAEEFIPQSMLVDLSSSPPYVYIGGLVEDANIIGTANHNPSWVGKFRLDNGATISAKYPLVLLLSQSRFC